MASYRKLLAESGTVASQQLPSFKKRAAELQKKGDLSKDEQEELEFLEKRIASIIQQHNRFK